MCLGQPLSPPSPTWPLSFCSEVYLSCTLLIDQYSRVDVFRRAAGGEGHTVPKETAGCNAKLPCAHRVVPLPLCWCCIQVNMLVRKLVGFLVGASLASGFLLPSPPQRGLTRCYDSASSTHSKASATGLSLPQIAKRLKFEVIVLLVQLAVRTRGREGLTHPAPVVPPSCAGQVTDLDEGVYGLDSNDPAYGIEIVKVNVKLKPGLGIGLEV